MKFEPLPDDFIDKLLTEPKRDKPDKVDRTGLVYCDFCKGYYNEYHFGDIDEDEV